MRTIEMSRLADFIGDYAFADYFYTALRFFDVALGHLRTRR